MTEQYGMPEGYQPGITKVKLPENKPSAEQVARGQAMDEMKDTLAEEQRRAAEDAPHQPFKYRLPLDVVGSLTSEETEELRAHERLAYDGHIEKASAKDAQRRSWIAAGGDGESFEGHWQEVGEYADTLERAESIQRQSGSILSNRRP